MMPSVTSRLKKNLARTKEKILQGMGKTDRTSDPHFDMVNSSSSTYSIGFAKNMTCTINTVFVVVFLIKSMWITSSSSTVRRAS